MTGDGRGDAEIVARLGEVSQRIAVAAARSGRTAAAVTLVGATKGVEAARVAVAVHAGLRDVGENRAQDLLAKAPEVTAAVGSSPLRWHFLGALQRNKVAALAPWITLWESVDRPALAGVIARHAPGARVLVEVNLGGEPQKAGCRPDATGEVVEELRGAGLAVEGLMAVPPLGQPPRPWFARLRALGEQLGLDELSMGMSDDYEAAIEEGATIVRVGRAIFGERKV